MKVVRFTARQSPYQAGDVAGFPDAVAERYLAEGVAVPFEDADGDNGATTAAPPDPPSPRSEEPVPAEAPEPRQGRRRRGP